MPLTRSLRGCRQRRKELDARGRGRGDCRCCRRGVQKVAKLRAAVLGLLGNSCGNELEKKCAACDAESISSKPTKEVEEGKREEEKGEAASPERFLKITKLLSICSRGRNSNSNNNNGMSLTTINHGRLSGRVAAWVCLVGVHRRLRHCACLARLIVLCLRLQRCFIFALNFASLTC